MHKIYIDSIFRTNDSKSSNDFKIQLHQPLEIQENMKLYKNGSVVTAEGLYDGETNNIETSNRPAVSGTAVLDLVANDYVELAIRSNVTTGNYNVYAQFGVERLAS